MVVLNFKMILLKAKKGYAKNYSDYAKSKDGYAKNYVDYAKIEIRCRIRKIKSLKQF